MANRRPSRKTAAPAGSPPAAPPPAPTVRALPRGLAFSPSPGETLLDAALRAGLPLASSCGGRAVCGDCFVRVVPVDGDGTGAFPPPDAEETAFRTRRNYQGPLRLACCLRVTSDCAIGTTYW